MPTAQELAVMNVRKNAAQSAIKFFTEKKTIVSDNNPFAFTTAADTATVNAYRAQMQIPGQNTIANAFDHAAASGVGRCDEKGRICYAALASNPLLAAGSPVTLIQAINYDHVFVVVADAAVAGATDVAALGLTAMIVDGWTEDWYFPNLNAFSAGWHSLGNAPNPRQLYVRVQIQTHQFQPYGLVAAM